MDSSSVLGSKSSSTTQIASLPTPSSLSVTEAEPILVTKTTEAETIASDDTEHVKEPSPEDAKEEEGDLSC